MLDKNRLLGKIAEHGYTQKSLAAALGIGNNTMSNKINGKSSLSIEEAELICEILHITDAEEKGRIFFANLDPETQQKIV